MTWKEIISSITAVPRAFGVLSLFVGAFLTVSSQWLKSWLLEWEKLSVQFFSLFSLDMHPAAAKLAVVGILIAPLYFMGSFNSQDKWLSRIHLVLLLIFLTIPILNGIGIVPDHRIDPENIDGQTNGRFVLFIFGLFFVNAIFVASKPTFLTIGAILFLLLVDRVTVLTNLALPAVS